MYVHICIVCTITYYIVILWFVISYYFIHTHACAKNLRITVPWFFYGNEVSPFLHIRCLHVFATFCPTAKLQVDAKEALTNGYQRGPWQSRWSLSWKFQWHSEKTKFVNGKQAEWIHMYNCIHVLFGNISFSCFLFWFRSCALHWWMSDKAISHFSVILAIPGDASKTSSWKKHRNLEFFNMQHPFWVWKLRTCAPLVSSCWKVLTLILAVEIEEIGAKS